MDLYGPSLPPGLRDNQSLTLTRDMSRINIQVSPRNPHGWSRLDPKNMQIKENTRLGPDTCLNHHLQRKIIPLYPCKGLPSPLGPLLIKTNLNTIQTHFLCQLTCQSADIMLSLCGVGVRGRVRMNNFSSKTTRPRDVLFFLKDTLSIEDEKLFKACKSVCSSVC